MDGHTITILGSGAGFGLITFTLGLYVRGLTKRLDEKVSKELYNTQIREFRQDLKEIKEDLKIIRGQISNLTQKISRLNGEMEHYRLRNG